MFVEKEEEKEEEKIEEEEEETRKEREEVKNLCDSSGWLEPRQVHI